MHLKSSGCILCVTSTWKPLSASREPRQHFKHEVLWLCQRFVHNALICIVIAGQKIKLLRKTHLCIYGMLCVKFYFGDTNTIVFLTTNLGYKFRGKMQVQEACNFCKGSSFYKHKNKDRNCQTSYPYSTTYKLILKQNVYLVCWWIWDR